MIKFLGELWIYHMIETDTIFDILYTLVSFGHGNYNNVLFNYLFFIFHLIIY